MTDQPVTIARDGDIAIVTVDNPPVNALGAAVRQGLWDAVATLDADDAVRAVLLTCAGRTFIAGADVREFGQTPVEPHLPDLVDRIEAAAKPWCAAIHGTALGGGFEVALGCRWRVAVASAKIGLPEVNLGIIPGASGTVRTPRLAGVQAAVALATTGVPVAAAKAQSMGLIDAVVTGDLVPAATDWLRAAVAGDWPLPVSQRPVTSPDADFWDQAEKATRKAAKGATAPMQALASIRFAAGHDFAAAMANERETFTRLRDSDQAAALRRVFFAERAATRPASIKGVDPRPVNRVGIIGGGTMGAGIAAACRNAGLPVVLIERDQAALDRGMANLAAIFDGGVKRGKLTAQARDDLMAGVTPATDYAALADADLVIEAVFEELGVKRAVFTALAEACRPDAVLATNTSYLDPRLIAEGIAGPERIIALHFFSPANLMKLLEIIPTPQTAPDVLATGFALAKRLGKMPVQSGICDGFIGNRILRRYRNAAEDLVRDGVAIAEIDAAMRDFGMAMGPFEVSDLAGIDIAYLQRKAARDRGEDIPRTLGDVLVEAGRKGRKTDGGWYDYTDGRPTPSPATAALLDPHIAPPREMARADIAAALVGEMAAEGQAILDEGIAAQASDIDLVKIHGYGFPRWRGGPMFVAGRKGA